MSGGMVTRQQSTLLEYIARFQKENQYCPSFDEMAQALGLKSKSSISRMLDALAERGHIRKLTGLARAIEIVQSAPVATSPKSLDQEALETIMSLCQSGKDHPEILTAVRVIAELALERRAA
jgi:SOS-response transcriptional repressor LexA